MAGKSGVLQYQWLKCAFNSTTIPNLTGTTGGTTQLWVGLHTADPGEAMSTASEGGYGAYTRAQTDRTTAGTSPFGWSVSSGTVATVAPVGNIDFPTNVAATTGTFTHVTIWPSSNATATAGLWVGTVTPNINFSNGVTPRITTSSSITED